MQIRKMAVSTRSAAIAAEAVLEDEIVDIWPDYRDYPRFQK
jgi:hypothetical protein